MRADLNGLVNNSAIDPFNNCNLSGNDPQQQTFESANPETQTINVALDPLPESPCRVGTGYMNARKRLNGNHNINVQRF